MWAGRGRGGGRRLLCIQIEVFFLRKVRFVEVKLEEQVVVRCISNIDKGPSYIS